jgi:hypothetical protein
MDFKQKYLKYKQKYLNLKNLQGGFLHPNDAFRHIESIGFEFETRQISPFIGTIKDKTLTLEPFGYNDKISDDSTFNPSTKIVIIETNETDDTDDTYKFDLTQDSYNNGDINDITYTMTELLKGKDNSYSFEKIHSSFSKINNIKFIVNDNKTIGHSEFIMTYKNIEHPSQNIIMEKTNFILNKINSFFTIGAMLVEKINISDKMYNLYYFNKNEQKYFLIMWEGISTKDIYFGPQITIGVKLENYSLIYESIINIIKKEYLITNFIDVKQFLNKILSQDQLDNVHIYNFLILLFTYISTIYTVGEQITNVITNENLKKNIALKEEDKLKINRYYCKFCPRQFFSTILKNNTSLNDMITSIFLLKQEDIKLYIDKYLEKKIPTSQSIDKNMEKLKNIWSYINATFSGTKIDPPDDKTDMIYIELRFIEKYLNTQEITPTLDKLINYKIHLHKSMHNPVKETQSEPKSSTTSTLSRPINRTQNTAVTLTHVNKPKKRKRDNEDNGEQ